MTTVLVTGATGFLGPSVVAALKRDGADVVPLGHRDGDLLDPAARDRVCRGASATHLVHLAWIATPGVFWSSAENVAWAEATLGLARSFAAAGGTRFVLTGSGAEYGTGDGICSEAGPPSRPATLYGVSKLAVAEALFAGSASLGLSVAEGRVFQLYGPREPRDRLFPTLATSLLAGRPVECTDGVHRRDFVHVDDAGAAIARLALSDLTGAVNIGSGVATPVAEAVRVLAQLAGRPDLVRLGARPTPEGEPPLVVADVTRARDELGWTAAHDLASGLSSTLEWWRAAAR